MQVLRTREDEGLRRGVARRIGSMENLDAPELPEKFDRRQLRCKQDETGGDE